MVNKPTKRAVLPLAVAWFVLVGSLPPLASAYPGKIDEFDDGTTGAVFNITLPPAAALAGRFSIPSNATVTSARVGLTGHGQSGTYLFADSVGEGLPQGTTDDGALLSSEGVGLDVLSGSTEFSGGALSGGVFNGTRYEGGEVVLTQSFGTYTTPPITSNGFSYGRLISEYESNAASYVGFSVVDSNGTVVQSGFGPWGRVTVNASEVPEIRIRVSMACPSFDLGPALQRLGAGFVVSYSYKTTSTAIGEVLETAQPTTFGVQVGQSLLNWTETAGNPYISPAPGTWHHGGILTGPAVRVGTELWMYVAGVDTGGALHIGRMVSADGGQSWVIDDQPLLNSTASSWDEAYVGSPNVMIDDDGTFKMWYMGAGLIDEFGIGLATSQDGLSWTKHANNPVLGASTAGWDDYNVGWPAVVKVGPTYTLLFSGRNGTDARKSIGYATSPDGSNWVKNPGNPVIARGDAPEGSYDILTSQVVYADGAYYLYWVCGSAPADYDTCVSYSNDLENWAHYSGNPVLTHGDGAWDSVTAENAARYQDPLTGVYHMLFIGRPGSASYSVGRAESGREPGGTLTQYVDLFGDLPRSFLEHTLVADVPPETSVQASVAVSFANSTYGGVETLEEDDSSISTNPNDWLKYQVSIHASSDGETPSVEGWRIAYDRFAPVGVFTSAPRPQPWPVNNATITVVSTVPSGTSLDLLVSNDDGATWVEARSGVRTDFQEAGAVLRYRLVFWSDGPATPVVQSVSGSLGVGDVPRDIQLLGADGVEIGKRTGPLDGTTVVPLDPLYFNHRIEPHAEEGSPVPFELWVNETGAGTIRVDFLEVQLEFPDATPASTSQLDPIGGAPWLIVLVLVAGGAAFVVFRWQRERSRKRESGDAAGRPHREGGT